MIREVMSLLHEKYENMISEYLDGELSEAEEKELILHLEGCPDCAEHLAFVKKLSENLSIAPEEPSPDFTERLMNRLAFESFEEEKKEENKPIRLFNKKSFALAACLALVIITALFAVPRLGGGAKLAAGRSSNGCRRGRQREQRRDEGF
jgi:anti-sigma factor RsiW